MNKWFCVVTVAFVLAGCADSSTVPQAEAPAGTTLKVTKIHGSWGNIWSLVELTHEGRKHVYLHHRGPGDSESTVPVPRAEPTQ